MKKPANMSIQPSSGNVFADLGLPDAPTALAKADLAIAIGDVIAKRRLTELAAAALLGIGPAEVSALKRGALRGFSCDRLARFLETLNRRKE